MFKKILLIAVAAFIIFGISNLSFAMMCASNSEYQQMAQTAKQAASEKAVNVGNKICPVSDEKIGEKAKVTYEYEGKIYNFCCPACIEIFKKNPQKYIDKVESEIRTGRDIENRAEKLMMKESEAQDTIHQERRSDR
ncbi:MAG: YHS domain-containing protein [Candidatus Omnitrophica bacterium]|nr:YHS domain-containing protein [Candidatus Omnitrophota bacterium]MDD5237909.1 YHS domain-containing protein [Candidatus Omnitrophota bacterium]